MHFTASEESEQLQDTGPFLKAFRFGGSFGSAVDEKNKECIVLALSAECIYVVAHLARLARQWMKRTRNELF